MSPKTLTGAELELDDGPARDCDLFLVDGNNLAYRAFFALPEELATSEGFATGALLGFTNMLFKLLSDYRQSAHYPIMNRYYCPFNPKSAGSRRHTLWMWFAGFPDPSACVFRNCATNVGPWTWYVYGLPTSALPL